MKKTINQIIVEFMKFLKIRYCFGVPGSNMSLLDEINKSKKIKLVLSKHEEGASFMASGFSKSTGFPCSCFGSVGPGATNLVTGVAAAYYDSQPILVLSGQVDFLLRGKASFQESTGVGRTINQLKIFENITKYAARIDDEKDIMKILKNVYFALKDNRPGPAYLEIPTDVMEKEIDISMNIFENFEKENKKRLMKKISLKKIKEMSNKLLNAKRPAILLGAGAIGCRKEVINFINKTKIPVLTTLKGRGIISDEHPLSLGTIGVTGQKSANDYLDTIDFLIIVGASMGQLTTKNWNFNFKNTCVARLDVSLKDLTKNYKTNYLFLGDISKTLSLITASIKNCDLNFKDMVDSYRKEGYFDYPEMNINSIPLKPQTFVSELRKLLPKNTIVCTESIAWFQKHFKIYYPLTQIVCTGFAPIGCSLSEAIGAKLGNKNKIVVSVEGDGGFQMTAMELMTVANYKIPIISIVLNNSILGPIYHSQIKKYKRSFMSEFSNPSYSKLAESFGIKYFRITKKQDINNSIKRSLENLKKGNSVLIEVKIDK